MRLWERGAITDLILMAKRTVRSSPKKEEGMGTEESPVMRMVIV
jgi:hypothetical protein